MVTQAQSQAVESVDSLNSINSVGVSGNLLIMGDSLSAAYGLETHQGWGSLLQEKLKRIPEFQNVQVVNVSISGETTSGGKQRLPVLLKEYRPNWMLLELGANDALRGQNLNSTKRNLSQMIRMCQEAAFPCKVMLLGIRLPTNYGPAYDQSLQAVYQQLAQEHQLIFDPFFLEEVALDPDLMQPDALHPNAQAQPEILQRLWPNIEKLLD